MKRALVFLILIFLASLCSSQQIKAVFTENPPRINGTISAGEWETAAIITDFIQREPNTGDPASENTIAKICYDKDNLYVCFQCFDDPKKITAKQIARDAALPHDDKIVLILDTFLDRRNAYWFEINARGSKGDALFSQNGAAMNKDWDGIWLGRSSITEHGWETELAIPFKSLNFHPTQTTWGLKLNRTMMHKSESVYWPVANLNTHKYQISDAGDLVGLEGISQGMGLDIRPYALGSMEQFRGKDNKFNGDAGLDVFYQLTPGIKSVFTVNTDFAQTEVDDRQVNLTRFKLFFPEKRDFFLDGASYFQFANEGESRRPKMITFFSRRIGLGEAGTPIPILGGVKVTGQSGPWNIGLLDVADKRDNGRQNFAIARVSRNFGEQSAVGVIATHGNADSDADNSVFGVDAKLATSTFRGNKNLVAYAYGLKSNTENLSGNDAAFGGEVSYPNDFFMYKFGYVHIGENFTPGVGFLPRKNIKNSYGALTLGPRPNRWGILQLSVGTEFDYITDMDNRLLTREVDIEPLGIRFLSGDEFTYELSQQYEVLNSSFNIYGDYIIPQNSYEFVRQSLNFETAQRRQLWTGIEYEWGDFWNGSSDKIELAAGYKIGVPVSLELQYEHNDVTLPVGDFSVDVYRVNFDLLFNARVTLKSFIQYDDESERLGWQSRLRWILKPGNEILFVWNSLWSDPMDRLNPRLADFTLEQSTTRFKVNYNYRF